MVGAPGFEPGTLALSAPRASELIDARCQKDNAQYHALLFFVLGAQLQSVWQSILYGSIPTVCLHALRLICLDYVLAAVFPHLLLTPRNTVAIVDCEVCIHKTRVV